MSERRYPKAAAYSDLSYVYTQTSGPGALELTEFLAEKIPVKPGDKVLDVGTNSGYQTCFLAKEFGAFVVGIDPWGDSVERLTTNASAFNVANRVVGLKVGVPDTKLASASFDAVISTTTLEMIRGMEGDDGYRRALAEIHRVLKSGGRFALAEPMHKAVPIPEEIRPMVTTGDMPAPWSECFATLEATRALVESVGFGIIEAAEPPDAHRWWDEFGRYSPGAEDDWDVLKKDRGRWVTLGYVIAEKRA